MTQTQTPQAATATGSLSALTQEHDYEIDDFEGALPAGLTGTLYRNGPGRWEAGGQPLGHVFDGDGMLSMFAIDGEGVRYRNRYVRTNHFMGTREGHGVPQRGLGTLRPGGMRANAFRRPANTANTNVVLHAGELLALWEGGNPHALDPDTLQTLGTRDFDGELRWLGAFSAHPKLDPATGDLYNFGLEVVPRPMLRTYRVDPQGRMTRLRDVHLPAPVFNHDVALTSKHMAFVIDPITIRLRAIPRVALGLSTFDEAMRYRAEQGTTIVLVPRDGSKPRIVQTEALMHFHVSNAYEDGQDTVIDLVQWPQDWNELNSHLRDFRTTTEPLGGSLTRLRVTPQGRVLREQLSEAAGEFPQFDARMSGLEHRYSYLAARGPGAARLGTIVKTDHWTATDRTHHLPPGHEISEPIFVPRSVDSDEDDGWLLAVAYDPELHRSRLVILDAQNIEAKPLYAGHLRHHIPQGFHGTFTNRIARP